MGKTDSNQYAANLGCDVKTGIATAAITAAGAAVVAPYLTPVLAAYGVSSYLISSVYAVAVGVTNVVVEETMDCDKSNC